MKLTGKIGTFGWSKFLLNEKTRKFEFVASAVYDNVALELIQSCNLYLAENKFQLTFNEEPDRIEIDVTGTKCTIKRIYDKDESVEVILDIDNFDIKEYILSVISIIFNARLKLGDKWKKHTNFKFPKKEFKDLLFEYSKLDSNSKDFILALL